MPRGAKPTTGRYETREELVAGVWRLWDQPHYRQSHIARITRVSESTVANILKKPRPTQETPHETKAQDLERKDRQAPDEARR